MTKRKLIWGLVAALPLVVFSSWAGWQAVASADTGTAAINATLDCGCCCEDPACPPGCDVDCPPDCIERCLLDCCSDPACPPGCDLDCPPNCDLLCPAETVTANEPAAPKTCNSATGCCTTACASN